MSIATQYLYVRIFVILCIVAGLAVGYFLPPGTGGRNNSGADA